MKKIFLSIFTLVSLASLAACGNDSTTSSTAKNNESSEKVTAWAWDPTFNIKALELADKAYNEEQATLDIVSMSQEDTVQKLNTSLSSGNLDGLPSIVLIEDTKIQGYLESFPDAFEDLSDIVNEDDFASYKFAVSKKDGKVYGVPFDSGVTGLFYRIDYLSEAGYTPEDLENITWDEFTKIGKDVKDKTGHAFLALNPSDLGLIRIVMQSAGEWYTSEDGKSATIENNKALKYGITLFADLIKSGIATQVASWDAGVESLNNGDVASVVSGSWYSSSIMSAEDQKGKWQIAPTPKIGEHADSVNASNIGGGSWYVLKGVGNTEKAKDFLAKTFASNKELTNTLLREISLVSTMKAAGETEEANKPSEFYNGQTIFKDFANWMNQIPAVHYGNNTNQIESIMTEYIQRLIAGEDIDDLLKEAQTQIDSSIAN